MLKRYGEFTESAGNINRILVKAWRKKIVIAVIVTVFVISLIAGLLIVPNILSDDNSDSLLSKADADKTKTPRQNYENKSITTHEFDYSNIVSFNISDELTDNTHVDNVLLGSGVSYNYKNGYVCHLSGLTANFNSEIKKMDNTPYYEKIDSDKTQQGYETHIYKDKGSKHEIYQAYIDLNNLTIIESEDSESHYSYFQGHFLTLTEAEIFVDTFKVNFNNTDNVTNNTISKMPQETDIKTHEYTYADIVIFNISDELTPDTNSGNILFGESKTYTYKDGFENMLSPLVSVDNNNVLNLAAGSGEKIDTNKTQQGYEIHLYKLDTNDYQLFIDLNQFAVNNTYGSEKYDYFVGSFETLKEAEIFIDTFKVTQ